MIVYNGEDFKELSKTKGLILVDYFATWCGPCKMLMPVLEDLAEEMTDVPFYKVDIDLFRNKAIEAQVQSVPTLVLYKDGVEVDRSLGYRPKAKLEAWVNSFK
ncbi:MAG: thioredoxin [Acholeplasmataceae bacterium]|nr:thioredoxin [Acholeplasmataceae bacterium]